MYSVNLNALIVDAWGQVTGKRCATLTHDENDPTA